LEARISKPDEATEQLIDAGFDNPDPEVQKRWKQIPYKGERPTPEDLIPYIARMAKAAH